MMTGADNGGKKRKRTWSEVNKNDKKSAITTKTVEGNMDKALILRLPCHMVLEIFLKLPVKTLVQCHSVCKAWRSLTSGFQFANLYFSRAPGCILVQWNSSRKEGSRNLSLVDTGLLPSSDAILRISNASNFTKFGIDIVGSCNGLLCTYDRQNNGPIYISNPIIGEYLSIPSAADDPNLSLLCGFGFSLESNEYKVVQFLRKSSCEDKMEGKVWTFGTYGWRSVGDLPYSFSSPDFGTLLNGKLHWVTYYSGSDELIRSFDLESENFQPLRAPPDFYFFYGGSFWGNAGVLEGCLCIGCSRNVHDSRSRLEFWVMNDYGVESSWTKKYVIRDANHCWWNPRSFQVIRGMENSGNMLVLYDSRLFFCNPTTEEFRSVNIYGVHSLVEAIWHVPFSNPTTEEFRRVDIDGVHSLVEAIWHVPSFMSLKMLWWRKFKGITC